MRPPGHYLAMLLLGGGKSDPIAISDEEFAQIQRAKRLLEFGLGLEEKFNLLIENYAELELELLRISLQDCVFFGTGTVPAIRHDVLAVINRRLTNYLSGARSYRDQTYRAFSRFYSRRSSEYEAIEHAVKAEEAIFGYRVMEAIRDHAQHRNWPIRLVTFRRTRVDPPSDRPLRFGLTPSVDVAALDDDPDFDESVLVS